MGISPSFPAVRRQPLRFVDSSQFNTIGKRVIEAKPASTDDARELNTMDAAFVLILVERETNELAKEQYIKVTAKEIQAKYPNLTVDEIRDMRAQFQHYDVNNDGVLDFDELSKVLDIMGDLSTESERRQQFQDCTQGSESLTFENYVAIMAGGSQTWRSWSRSSSANIRRLKLSIIEQIQYGVF